MQPNDLTLTDVLLKVHQDYPKTMAAIYACIALVIVMIVATIWLIFGAGPRRRRGMRAARNLLKAGNWKGALEQLQKVRNIGSPSASWRKHFVEFEGECLKAATIAAIHDKKFEDALEYGQRAAHILDEAELDVRVNVQAEMLREVRRLFSKHGETKAASDLIGRTLLVQSPCREASFWQAMCDLRGGAMDAALSNLQAARTGEMRSFNIEAGFVDPTAPTAPAAPPTPYIDPALYLGAILLRMGQAKESLRFLTEANRMDANCPFITLQLGAAIVTAGGDTNMAVRALQRSLGPKGLGQWQDDPHRAWVEGLPDNRSYVRKLAAEFPFTCPVFGEDLKYLIRQGNLALAQGQFKLGNFQEAAELFDKVLKEGAPSLPVLRGLGLSLAKLGRYDDAFIHLRTAHEMEEVKDRHTAGYLALCGACGKPASPEHKLENTAWAIRLVTQFNAPGDAEWIDILNRIFDEARRTGIPLSNDDQLYLCEHLVSGNTCDVLAGRAYHHLIATDPTLMRPEYAWLYCRADEQHPVGGDHALALYELTFANPEPARAFFAERGWNFDDIELMYLRRAAELAPGRFPAVLGPDYPPRGEQLLIAHSQQLEAAGKHEDALATIEVLVRLSPQNTAAMDRAAELHYRAKRLEPAFDLLEQWHHAQPTDPLPLVRQGLLLQQQAQSLQCYVKLHAAMALCTGRRRANIAFLGARVALQSYLLPPMDQTSDPAALSSVQAFLQDCLTHDPAHPHALWCSAAVRWLQGDAASLATQGPAMQDENVADPRYHYLAALCLLLDGQFTAVPRTCERVAKHAASLAGRNGNAGQLQLANEAGYLAALAHIGQGEPHAAIDALKPIVRNPASPTLSYAQALLGNVYYSERRHEEAIVTWQTLDPKDRQTWGLTEPLAQTMFIAALESLLAGEYEQAADKFRQAGKQGCRDRRLGPLLLLALFKAGQHAIYASETSLVRTTEPAIPG